MSRLCDAYKCYGEKKISREWRFLEDIFLTKQLGIVSVRKKYCKECNDWTTEPPSDLSSWAEQSWESWAEWAETA